MLRSPVGSLTDLPTVIKPDMYTPHSKSRPENHLVL
jgi:hypothetical protein